MLRCFEKLRHGRETSKHGTLRSLFRWCDRVSCESLVDLRVAERMAAAEKGQLKRKRGTDVAVVPSSSPPLAAAEAIAYLTDEERMAVGVEAFDVFGASGTL